MKIKMWMATEGDGRTWLFTNEPKRYNPLKTWVPSGKNIIHTTAQWCHIGKNIDGQTWADKPRRVTLDTKEVK